MCKLLIMTGITEGLVAQEFMSRIGVLMSERNNDGIGYSAIRPDGSMFTERWRYNDSFFNYDTIMTPEIAKKLQAYKNRLPAGALDTNYSTSGEKNFSDVRTVTMHTRFATCAKSLMNVHPFVHEDVSLVHNGVIRNHDVLNVNKISTCDSEAALQTYISRGVQRDTSKAKGWLDILTGSYAFGVLSRNDQGNRILDVVRGSSFLYRMEIEGLGTVFCTDDADGRKTAIEMGLNIMSTPVLVDMNSMFRFDAVTGELLETVDIKPVYKAVEYYSGYGQGRTWDGYDDYDNYWGSGRHNYTGRANSSSHSFDSTKDKEYNQDLLGDTVSEVDEFPDLMTNGKIDSNKVSKYCSNTGEPLIDRLEVFDIAHDRDYVELFESLPNQLQDYVHDTDVMEGFKAARKLIDELTKVKEAKR